MNLAERRFIHFLALLNESEAEDDERRYCQDHRILIREVVFKTAQGSCIHE